MPEAIQTTSGTAYAAKVVDGTRLSTPSSAKRPTAPNSASQSPSRIPVSDTYNTNSANTAGNNTGNTNDTTATNSGAGQTPAHTSAAAAPPRGDGPTTEQDDTLPGPGPKAVFANPRVRNACMFLRDQGLMDGDEPEFTMDVLINACARFELMDEKATNKATKDKMKKIGGTIGKMLRLFHEDFKRRIQELSEKHEQEVLTVVKESLGRVEDRVEELQEQLSGAAPPPQRTGTGEPPNGCTRVLFATGPPPAVTPRDRKARNAEYVRDKQVLFKPCMSEAPEGIDILPPLCAENTIVDRFTKAIKDGNLEAQAGCALLPLTVRRLNNDILVSFPSPDAAKWIRTAEGSEALEHHLRYHISAVGRKYKVVAHIVPTTFVANDKDAMREIELANGLPANCIENAQYIKPIALRSPGQRHANIMLTLANPYSANATILDGVLICGMRSQCWRQKYEPPRCARCQGHGHIVKTCHHDKDVCGICGDEHRDRDCPRTGKLWCRTCNTDKHSSRDRLCPAFIRRCAIFDARHPENTRVFFPTEEAWTLEAMVDPGAPFSSYLRQERAPKPTIPPATLGQVPALPARKGSQRARRAAANAKAMDLRTALEKAAEEAATANTNAGHAH